MAKLTLHCLAQTVFFLHLTASQNGTDIAFSSTPATFSTSATPTPTVKGNSGDATDLLQVLLENYDPRIRPGHPDKPLVVQVDMFIANIWTMKEVNMDFTVDLYLRQYWKDERLMYSPMGDTFANLTLTSESNKQLWVPSTYFIGAKNAYLHDVTTQNYLLEIYPNGAIFYSIRLTVTVSCFLNLRHFPHDTQLCRLTLESYGYQVNDVKYIWKTRHGSDSPVQMDKFQLPQFDLLGVYTYDTVNSYNIGNHSSLNVDFKMSRRLGFHLINTYIPSIIIVAVSWISFWINPNSVPARISLGILTVLTMITISYGARQALPKVSYVRAIDWYLLTCLVFVCAATLEFTVLNYLMINKQMEKGVILEYDEDGDTRDSDNDLAHSNNIVEKGGEKFERKEKAKFRKLVRRKQNMEPIQKARKPQRTRVLKNPFFIDEMSRLGFPLAFIVANIIYWCLVLKLSI